MFARLTQATAPAASGRGRPVGATDAGRSNAATTSSRSAPNPHAMFARPVPEIGVPAAAGGTGPASFWRRTAADMWLPELPPAVAPHVGLAGLLSAAIGLMVAAVRSLRGGLGLAGLVGLVPWACLLAVSLVLIQILRPRPGRAAEAVAEPPRSSPSVAPAPAIATSSSGSAQANQSRRSQGTSTEPQRRRDQASQTEAPAPARPALEVTTLPAACAEPSVKRQDRGSSPIGPSGAQPSTDAAAAEASRRSAETYLQQILSLAAACEAAEHRAKKSERQAEQKVRRLGAELAQQAAAHSTELRELSAECSTLQNDLRAAKATLRRTISESAELAAQLEAAQTRERAAAEGARVLADRQRQLEAAWHRVESTWRHELWPIFAQDESARQTPFVRDLGQIIEDLPALWPPPVRPARPTLS